MSKPIKFLIVGMLMVSGFVCLELMAYRNPDQKLFVDPQTLAFFWKVLAGVVSVFVAGFGIILKLVWGVAKEASKRDLVDQSLIDQVKGLRHEVSLLRRETHQIQVNATDIAVLKAKI